jgi:hypothetical protein
MEHALLEPMGWYKIATDLGGIIGGICALLAGGLAYLAGWLQARATRLAADRQLAADGNRDRLRTHGIAVGIYPELTLSIRGDYEKAQGVIDDWSKPKPGGITTTAIAARIRDARISVPPLLDRFTGDLHLLGDAGPSVLQLVSFIWQYDSLIDDGALNVERQAKIFNPISLAGALSPHLKNIGERLDEAEQKVAVIHDKAVPPA